MLVLVKEDVEERVGKYLDSCPTGDVCGYTLSSGESVDEVRLGLQRGMIRPEVASDDSSIIRGELDGM